MHLLEILCRDETSLICIVGPEVYIKASGLAICWRYSKTEPVKHFIIDICNIIQVMKIFVKCLTHESTIYYVLLILSSEFCAC